MVAHNISSSHAGFECPALSTIASSKNQTSIHQNRPPIVREKRVRSAEGVKGDEVAARGLPLTPSRSSEPSAGVYRPVFVRIEPGELGPFRESCVSRGLQATDSIEGQLVELARIRQPASTQEQWCLWAEERLETYRGCWVHLPWERRVARILEPDDYFEVVTNRNRDKITVAEQQRLRTKRVGVMGLSVGGEFVCVPPRNP